MLSLFFLLSEPDLMPYWPGLSCVPAFNGDVKLTCHTGRVVHVRRNGREVLESDALLAAFLIAFVVFAS